MVFLCKNIINKQKVLPTSDTSKKARISFRGDITTKEKKDLPIYAKALYILIGNVLGAFVSILGIALLSSDTMDTVLTNLDEGYKADNKAIKELKTKKKERKKITSSSYFF